MSAPHSINFGSSTPPSSLSGPFTITAPPGCDTWRAPPSSNRFTAPIIYHPIRLSAFRRARITISAPWKTLYDQGGIILVLPATPSSASDADGQTSRKWIKSGVEIVAGKPWVSTVATDNWSDWSLVPVPGASGAGLSATATVEFERDSKPGGALSEKLWVYAVLADGTRQPLREVTWVFAGEDGEAWIGAYAAKPNADEGDESKSKGIEVKFEGWELETSK